MSGVNAITIDDLFAIDKGRGISFKITRIYQSAVEVAMMIGDLKCSYAYDAIHGDEYKELVLREIRYRADELYNHYLKRMENIM